MRTTTKKRNVYQKRGSYKRLANPTGDVICIVVLTMVLMLSGYMHP
jgi:hypothetical protein